jgi:nucleotide-binding universal stress UspA family protein
MKVLAAIDDSAAAQPVLDVARRLGELIVAGVESVHVQEDGSGENAASISRAAHIPLHFGHGDIVAVLRSEARERDVIALVIGTRGVPAGPSPAGHVAIDLVQSLDRPIVVVPPHAIDRPLRRVLVAVEGDGESHALGRLFEQLGDLETPEVVALHVTAPSELPPFADSTVHEADAFAREFMIRSASGVVPDLSRIRFEMRVGDPADTVREAARELDADIVVFAWHRDLSEGHGRVVREMLAEASIPVALFPYRDREHAEPGSGRATERTLNDA